MLRTRKVCRQGSLTSEAIVELFQILPHSNNRKTITAHSVILRLAYNVPRLHGHFLPESTPACLRELLSLVG